MFTALHASTIEKFSFSIGSKISSRQNHSILQREFTSISYLNKQTFHRPNWRKRYRYGHEHTDSLLVKAGSGAAVHGVPTSAGVTASAVQDTLVAIYKDLDSVESCLRVYPGQIAGVIVESIAANMGIVPPQSVFPEGLRALTERDGSLLIFDEVVTGFRVGYAGAQGLNSV